METTNTISGLIMVRSLVFDHATTDALEDYLIEQLCALASRHALDEIPGIPARVLDELQRHLTSGQAKAEVDPGIIRLVGAVGARTHIRFEPGFYQVTPLRERAIKAHLSEMSKSYYPAKLSTIMQIHFGLDGHAVGTYADCDRAFNTCRGATFYRTIIDGVLEQLLAPVCLVYAGEAFDKPEDIPIKYLGLPTRSYNLVRRLGYQTVADLMKHTRKELLEEHSVGPKTLSKIEFGLDFLGYHLTVD